LRRREPDPQHGPPAIKADPPSGLKPEIAATAQADEDLFPFPARQRRPSGAGEGESRPLDRQSLEVVAACL